MPDPEIDEAKAKLKADRLVVSERPDPVKPVGLQIAEETILPYRNPSSGALKFVNLPGTELSVFTPNGENIAHRLPQHPITEEPMLEEASGARTWIDIKARLYSHALHFSEGMIKVRAVLAPLTRQITNSVGLQNSSHLLSAIRDWFRLDWVGGHLGRIVSALIPGFNTGQFSAGEAPGRGDSLTIKDPPKERGGD
jgi:hypothetical protein